VVLRPSVSRQSASFRSWSIFTRAKASLVTRGAPHPPASDIIFSVFFPYQSTRSGNIYHQDIDLIGVPKGAHTSLEDQLSSNEVGQFFIRPVSHVFGMSVPPTLPVPPGEAGAFIAERNTVPGAGPPLNTNGGRSFLHAFRQVRDVCIAGERAPDARVSSRPDPGVKNLGLPRGRRHVRRKRNNQLATVAPGRRYTRPPTRHVRGVLSGMAAHVAEAVPETGEAA
jgi:hypothetical protein